MSLFFFGNNFYKNKESFKVFSWQHSSYSNNKIVHNSIEHFLCNLSDFFSDDVLFCLWIVFTNSVFQVPPQKIVRRVEILGIGWPGVIGLTWNESTMGSYAWGIQVFCSRWWFEMRCCLISQTEHLNTSGITCHRTDPFNVKPITPGHPIPKISTCLSEGVPERQSLRKQFTDKRGHHQKRNQTDCTRIAQ